MAPIGLLIRRTEAIVSSTALANTAHLSAVIAATAAMMCGCFYVRDNCGSATLG